MLRARLVLTIGLSAALWLAAGPGHAEPRPGAIHVRVLDAASRQPLVEASVQVVEAGLSASTGPDGALVFGDLAPGSYT